MKLGEFIQLFSHNNIIRLHYQEEDGSYTEVEAAFMDWKVNYDNRVQRRYRDNEVIKLLSIEGYERNEPSAINIVIERRPISEIREERLKELLNE